MEAGTPAEARALLPDLHPLTQLLHKDGPSVLPAHGAQACSFLSSLLRPLRLPAFLMKFLPLEGSLSREVSFTAFKNSYKTSVCVLQGVSGRPT